MTRSPAPGSKWQLPSYRPVQPARPEDEHPFYQTWLEKEGYLKRNLDVACEKIAELTIENRALKEEIAKLPTGSQARFQNVRIPNKY
jgi:hypothetical protein